MDEYRKGDPWQDRYPIFSYDERTVTKETCSLDIQCRYHYLRQRNSREQEWTDEEDELLNKLAAAYKGKVNWLELSDTLALSKLRRTPRTALECKQRYNSLLLRRMMRLTFSFLNSWTLTNSKDKEESK